MRNWLQQALSSLKRFDKFHHKLLLVILAILVLASMIPPFAYGVFWWQYRDKVFPGVQLAGVDMSGYTSIEAESVAAVLENDYLSNKKYTVVVDGVEATDGASVYKKEIPFDVLGVEYLPKESVERLFLVGRNGVFWENLKVRIELWIERVDLKHIYTIDEKRLDEFVKEIATEVDKPAVLPHVEINKKIDQVEVQVHEGEDGLILDQDGLIARIKKHVALLSTVESRVGLIEDKKVVTPERLNQTKVRAEALVDKELDLILERDGADQSVWTLSDEDVVGFLDFSGGFNEDKIREYAESLAESINKKPQNALFRYENGKVSEFKPGVDGIEVVVGKTINNIVLGLEKLEVSNNKTEVLVVVKSTPPDLRTPEVNDLGIEELLGVGTSTFYHSIPGRVHNVALTAAKLNGVLVPPGEVFSFNETIGDVSAATGYKSAYIIKDGRTILGDGGGVCQDSTTLFRAILDVGLPVVERKAHAYRVSYYEQNSDPGFDATVYAPSPDLKFKNDTPGHLLIQTYADTNNLSLKMEIYGTDDGRKAEIVNYQKWGAVPAPPPLYQDDPTLEPGVVKQVDWASPGLKVKFDYVVERNGEKLFEKTFYSNFKPWQAVYLRGV